MGLLSSLSELLVANPWLSVLSVIIAVFGVVVMIALYFRSKRVRLPCYAIRSINLVSDLVGTVEPLEMLYSGQPIENLTATRIAFWNAGRETIRREDIASAAPLTVRVKDGCEILDHKILYEKNTANRFSVTKEDDRSHITLDFEYVDKDEGAVVQILHTGKSAEDLEFRGRIKGVSSLHRKSRRTIEYGYGPVAAAILMIALVAGYVIHQLVGSSLRSAYGGVGSVASFAVYFGVFFLVYSVLTRLFPRLATPKDFKVFEEPF